MPKRKEPELTKEEQFKRFVDTAKEHGVEPHEVEAAVKSIASRHQRQSPKRDR